MTSIFKGPVYRHIPDKNFADKFVTGESIWVSTFQACRNYEDAEKGDAGEGTMLHRIGDISSDDAGFQSVADNLGIVNRAGRMRIKNGNGFFRAHDAYVVCFSHRVFEDDLKQKFGKYAVRVADIDEFAFRLAIEMRKVVPVIRHGVGAVVYADRSYKDYDTPPGDIHFVKPTVPFKVQDEYRLVLICEPGHVYEPMAVSVPLPSGLCTAVY